MRMKIGDGILNSTLVITKGVFGFCGPSHMYPPHEPEKPEREKMDIMLFNILV